MFFEPSSFKERTLSMGHFVEWAGEIAGSYVNGGVAPTHTLCKIAQSAELTPHQISVLAAEANKEIHRIKYASVEDKYHAANFPLADAKAALAMLQADGGQTKVASAMPEPIVDKPELDAYGMWGIEAPQMDKTAEVKGELKTAQVHGELLAQKAQDKAIMSKHAAGEAEIKLIKEARQVVLSGENSDERLRILGKLDQFVKSAGVPDARIPLAKLTHVLAKEGLLMPKHAQVAMTAFMKKADVTAPEQLISDWLPAQIVNGEHPLYITLKTFKDCKDRSEHDSDSYKLVQDQLNIVKQRIRSL